MDRTIPIAPDHVRGAPAQHVPAAPVTLDEHEQAALRGLLAQMIPADPALGVPGADDPAIFADLLGHLGPYADAARATLAALDAAGERPFADLGEPERETRARDFLRQPPRAFADFYPLVVQCYYRDDRVMRSLGMDVRAPYPQGYELEQGDWSLLEVVRAREKLWREA